MTMLFERLLKRAEEAQREYERGLALLFRDEGRRERVYSDGEHEERERALRRERERKVDAVIAEIRSTVGAAEREIAVLEGGDPTALLSTTELAAANAKKPYADDDVWNAPEEGLAGKLRAVLAGGDRAATFAYWRAASARYRTILDARAAAGLPSSEATGPEDLREVLEEMRRRLAGPERLLRAERARRTVEEAVGAEMAAGYLRGGFRSPVEAWAGRR